MSRLGRDKLREERFSRSRQVTGWIVFLGQCDPVKEIGQTCDRSATVRPASRTLNRRMVTAAEPALQPVHGLRAIGERTELFNELEAGGFAAVREEAAAERPDRREGNREHAPVP